MRHFCTMIHLYYGVVVLFLAKQFISLKCEDVQSSQSVAIYLLQEKDNYRLNCLQEFSLNFNYTPVCAVHFPLEMTKKKIEDEQMLQEHLTFYLYKLYLYKNMFNSSLMKFELERIVQEEIKCALSELEIFVFVLVKLLKQSKKDKEILDLLNKLSVSNRKQKLFKNNFITNKREMIVNPIIKDLLCIDKLMQAIIEDLARNK